MASLIGVVSNVVGQVVAIASDGSRRVLIEGDRVFAGEQLETGTAGAVAIHLQGGGGELTMGRESTMTLSSALLSPNPASHVDSPETLTPSEAQLTDVEKLQAAIAAGEDPTQVAEATAAGPAATGAPGGQVGGGHTFVLLEEVAGRVDPIIGFPTAGFNGIPEFVEERVIGLRDDDDGAFVPPPVVVPPDNPVTLTGLSVEGGELTLSEASLALGSASNPAALTQSGTFSVSAPDGLLTLNVGGITVVNGSVASGVGQSITTGLGNTLTITGYNPTTGVVSYSYTLNGNDTHPAGQGANSLSEHFSVIATDSNGSTATNSLDINVVDDVPTAVNDSNAGVASETQLTLSGSVLTNDSQGADRVATGPVTAGTFTGTYGTLTLAADGTYTYTLNPQDADFLALKGGGNGTETFSYTLTDSDGDSSTANLVLNIHNNDDTVSIVPGINGNLTPLNEAHLPTGSAPDAAALTQQGSFTINAPDGLQSLSVGGINVISGGVVSGVGQSITTGLNNTLTVTGYDATTGIVTYTYTLNGNDSHAAGNGANVLGEQFSVIATDTNGTTGTSTLIANVIDDVPTAVNDNNDGIASESNLQLTGNVLTNDVQGADRVGAGPITAGTFTGTYGTLVLATDGTYTYTVHSTDPAFLALKGGGNGTDTFTYTLTDSDGDASTAQLVLNVHNNNDPVVLTGLDVGGGELTLYESNLPAGSTPVDAKGPLTQSGTFTVTSLDGLQNLSVGGIDIIKDGVINTGVQTLNTGLNNTFTVNGYNPVTGVVSYSYTLTGADQHPAGDGTNSVSEQFAVVATDVDGSTATGTVDVNIVDDVPSAANDTGGLIEGGTSTLNVLTNDVLGADGATVVAIKAGSNAAVTVTSGGSTVINGTYGTLTISADGTAVYKGTPNLVTTPTATDTFTYTIRDGDGDQSTATVTFNLTDSGLKVTSASQTTVFENALDLVKDGADLAQGTVTGSTPASTAETATGDLTTTTTGGVGPLTFTLQGSTTGTYGVLQLGSDGKYTYTLTSAPKTTPNANDGPNTVVGETFNYQAKDSLGNTTTGTIQINIVDDVPKAVAAERSVTTVKVDSNLLLTIDVSGSMGDPSGVPGLNRLQLAKQAITALLDKYAGMGDVMVQVVAFSSSATDVSGGWVTVAQAKAFVASLTAGGGTNYDAAVATSQTAFNMGGKLTGAQNVGYFFSDGAPTAGQNISASDEVALKAFLDANSIKNYAIGLGTGVSNANLNPLAYDGSTHTDTNAVVVTDLSQLNSVLAGTVIAPTVTGTLLEGGSFGADGGFIKSITVDGATYTYDPKASNGAGGLTFTGTVNHGTFNTVDNTLTIATNSGANLVINLDTGAYSYTPQTVAATPFNETIGFVVSDNDGDLAGSSVVIHVNPNVAPVAGNDNIITNILAPTIAVPGDVLLANDTDANGDPLSATPTTFTTLWGAKGAGFTSTTGTLPTGTFNATANALANQQLTVDRSSFKINTSTMTAALLVSGYLGAVTNAAANPNAEDVISVSLKQGETLNLDHNLLAGRIGMEYSFNGGAYTAIADGGTFTAGQTGTYQIHITNITNPDNSNAAETYNLNMTIGYANTTVSPNFSGSYIASDSHGGSDSGGVTLTYQAGTSLTGTAGDDVMLVAAGNNTVHGGDGNDVLSGTTGNNNFYGDAGNDLLFSGSGNDLLDGGTGNDTASYAHSAAGVTVTLASTAQQNTVGAGLDTLVSIENLTGSNFNDVLTGDGNANVINGGLGNDTLNGGGGDDILIGGMGNNTLTGGTGNDTFLYQQGNTGRDTVTDFTFGSDKLDLSQLLQGENATAASLDDYLHFKVTGSGATLVSSIDISAVAGATPTQTIDLAGVNLATQYGVTPGAGGLIAGGADTATIINGMLNDHSLKVDTV